MRRAERAERRANRGLGLPDRKRRGKGKDRLPTKDEYVTIGLSTFGGTREHWEQEYDRATAADRPTPHPAS